MKDRREPRLILVDITHQVNVWLIGCAWTYAALRYLHSYIHVTSNDVATRFRVYMASGPRSANMGAALALRRAAWPAEGG